MTHFFEHSLIWAFFFFFYLLSYLVKNQYFSNLNILIDLSQNAITASFFVFYLIFHSNTYGRPGKDKFTLLNIYVLVTIAVFTILANPGVVGVGVIFSVEFWSRLVVGLITGATMCLFVGQLAATKFIKIPNLIVGALFSYAIIRAFYSFLFINDIFAHEMPDGGSIEYNFHLLRDILYHSAFLFKVVLFLTIAWLIDTGRLLYFMIEECSLFNKGESNFNTFLSTFEIK